MRAPPKSHAWRLAGAVAVALAALAIAGCPPGGGGLLPPSRALRIPPAVYGSLLGYGRAQQFDTTFGVGDEQRLMTGAYPASAAFGPRLRIQPQRSSHAITRDSLARGHIVARWINRDPEPYWKLGSVGSDTVYWLVDSTAAGWRSRYLSTASPDSSVEDTTLVIHPSDTTHTRALARWLWVPSDEFGWVTCTSVGCCTSRAATAFLPSS